MATEKDEFYRDILEGMALYTGSMLQRDIVKVLERFDAPALGEALNKNQMASKMWLADELFNAIGPEIGALLVLGGWFGVLSAVLLHDQRFRIARATSLDIDPGCAEIALALNATHVRAGRFAARTGDMLDCDHGSANDGSGAPNIVVNTSCEHLHEFGRWYDRIPEGQWLVLQSNDYVSCSEHVNCVPDLESFKRQAPMREVRYAGERAFRRYVRFMLIGRK